MIRFSFICSQIEDKLFHVFFSKSYINSLRVRVTFYFVITTLSLIALIIGLFIQTLNFILNTALLNTQTTVLYLVLIPGILLFFAAIIDDFIDLIFDAMDNPPFIKGRAQLNALVSQNEEMAFKMIKFLNKILIIGYEVFPMLGVTFIYFFYGRLNLELFASGYILGGCLFSVVFGLIYTVCHAINSRSSTAQDKFFDYEIALNKLESDQGYGSSSFERLSGYSSKELDKRVLAVKRRKGFLFLFVASVFISGAVLSTVFEIFSTIVITLIFSISLISLRFAIKSFLPNFVGMSFTVLVVIFSIVAISMNATATGLLTTVDGTKPLIEYDSRKVNYNISSKSSIYPVCKMRWENSLYRKPSKYLTLIDLLPLSEIIYNYTPNHYDDASDVKSAVSRIYEGTNIGSVLVEQIDPMSQFTRSMIVYFEDLKIRVLVIRGTIMPAEMLYNLDVFSFVQVLNLFDKITPVIGLLPPQIVSDIVARVDFGKLVGIPDASEFTFKKAQKYHTMSIENKDEFIVLGHSLGGTLAGPIASSLDVSGIALNPAGSRSVLGRFNIENEEKLYKSLTSINMDKDVVNKVDAHLGSVNTLACKLSPVKCHDPKAILCEVHRICGDERNRAIITGCTEENFSR